MPVVKSFHYSILINQALKNNFIKLIKSTFYGIPMVVLYSPTLPQTSIKPINPTTAKVISTFYIPMALTEFVSILTKKGQSMMSHGDLNRNSVLYTGTCQQKQHYTIFEQIPFRLFPRDHGIQLNFLQVRNSFWLLD